MKQNIEQHWPVVPDLTYKIIDNRPQLIARCDDGCLIDVTGAKCEWHPAQQILYSWGREDIRVSDIYPITFSMAFTKPLNSPWVKWLKDNPNIAFTLWKVRFHLDSIITRKRDVLYRATGYISS